MGLTNRLFYYSPPVIKSLKKPNHSTFNILLPKPSLGNEYFSMLRVLKTPPPPPPLWLLNYVVFWSRLYNLNVIMKKHHTNPKEKYLTEKKCVAGLVLFKNVIKKIKET